MVRSDSLIMRKEIEWMKKDNIRDYATAAFRFYKQCRNDETDRILSKSEVYDIEAVIRVLKILREENKIDTLKAIDIVYFTDSSKPLRKGDISRRVVFAAHQLHINERKVYTLLSNARRMFANERGLRS